MNFNKHHFLNELNKAKEAEITESLNESIDKDINEFGPLAGSGNRDELEDKRREARTKSERKSGETFYVVGGRNGSYKVSKYYEDDNTYAAYHNGIAIPVDESVNEAKKYKKGDELKVKLKNGKEFDITFDSYSSNKGIAYGKIDGDRKTFSLDAVVSESLTEAKEMSKKEVRDLKIKINNARTIGKYFTKDEVEFLQSLFESTVNEARAYNLKASEFGGNTMAEPYKVKDDAMGSWRVHSTYAVDQVSGENDPDARDVLFFEVMPYKDEIVVKLGGINNLKRSNGSAYGKFFSGTKEDFKKDPKKFAKEASDFLTKGDQLKWANKNVFTKSEGKKIKWAMKDDYSSVIEDLIKKAI